MKMTGVLLFFFFVLHSISSSAQLSQHTVETSESEMVSPTPAVMEFFKNYTDAFNSQNIPQLISLSDPASKKCYQDSKHPEFFKSDFDLLFKTHIKSFKEIRKYKSVTKFYELMGYPENPSHYILWNAETPKDEKSGSTAPAIEVIEIQEKFFLLIRCH